jgi:hypothetical protein
MNPLTWALNILALVLALPACAGSCDSGPPPSNPATACIEALRKTQGLGKLGTLDDCLKFASTSTCPCRGAR